MLYVIVKLNKNSIAKLIHRQYIFVTLLSLTYQLHHIVCVLQSISYGLNTKANGLYIVI